MLKICCKWKQALLWQINCIPMAAVWGKPFYELVHIEYLDDTLHNITTPPFLKFWLSPSRENDSFIWQCCFNMVFWRDMIFNTKCKKVNVVKIESECSQNVQNVHFTVLSALCVYANSYMVLWNHLTTVLFTELIDWIHQDKSSNYLQYALFIL